MNLPSMMYGTAWKEEKTRKLVFDAIKLGFRAIDTANQRKHYFEKAVGEGILDAIESGIVTREELFIQTKFTFIGGQDHRLPYDPNDSVQDQVNQSFTSSLEHLGVSTLDSLVLHGPSTRHGLGKLDWDAWDAIQDLKTTGKVKNIGVSNINSGQLKLLIGRSNEAINFVQNRCYASMGWDFEIRNICREAEIKYQGFSLLTANANYVNSNLISELARKAGCTNSQMIFAFSREIGILPLTGTTSETHMQEDLKSLEIPLSAEDASKIERMSQ